LGSRPTFVVTDRLAVQHSQRSSGADSHGALQASIDEGFTKQGFGGNGTTVERKLDQGCGSGSHQRTQTRCHLRARGKIIVGQKKTLQFGQSVHFGRYRFDSIAPQIQLSQPIACTETFDGANGIAGQVQNTKLW
jgi:hypothetical protein